MTLNSLLSPKKLGFLAILLLFSAVSTHGALKAKGTYLGGELGYNQAGGYVHVGFRYIKPYHAMFGKVLLDIQPTFGIATGWGQVLRFEGGFNLGLGSDIDNVAFSFVLLGVHLQINLNLWKGFGIGIGPELMLPLSTNVYWKKFFFGMHWGMDLEWFINVGNKTTTKAGFQNPFFVRFVVGYKF